MISHYHESPKNKKLNYFVSKYIICKLNISSHFKIIPLSLKVTIVLKDYACLFFKKQTILKSTIKKSTEDLNSKQPEIAEEHFISCIPDILLHVTPKGLPNKQK